MYYANYPYGIFLDFYNLKIYSSICVLVALVVAIHVLVLVLIHENITQSI